MFTTLKNAFKTPDVRKKVLITLGILLLYRLGCWLPLPGLNPTLYSGDYINGEGSFLSLISAISGNALKNGAFLALGVSPYINASIIMQLLTIAIKPLETLSKQGDEGRKKIAQITRYVTLLLGIAQCVGIIISWANSGAIKPGFAFAEATPVWVMGVVIGVFMLAGTTFTMWLGERITETGAGNGISLLIFVGILSTTGQSLQNAIERIAGYSNGFSGVQDLGAAARNSATWELGGFLVMVVVIFLFIVFVDLAERKIPIQYAKQIKGRKQYGGQSTHIPIKVNATGVLPIIFATALISFPQLLFSMFVNDATDKSTGWYRFYDWWSNNLGAGSWAYSILVALLIFGFSYFYAQIQFNPEEVSRNIQQYGGVIPSIRPGRPTAEYLGKISRRLTFFGALFLAVIALIPTILFKAILGQQSSSLINAFSATGLLIVVSVALEFNKQLESLLMMKHYKGFLK
jgi:preprotein translocase subunit SecY